MTKLTPEQREHLLEALRLDILDVAAGTVGVDRLTTLIEDWLSTPPPGWTEIIEYRVHRPDREPVPSRCMNLTDARYFAERDGAEIHCLTVWESPWRDHA